MPVNAYVCGPFDKSVLVTLNSSINWSLARMRKYFILKLEGLQSIIPLMSRRLRQSGEHYYANRRADSRHAMPRAAFRRHRLRRVVHPSLSDVIFGTFMAVRVDDVFGFVILLLARFVARLWKSSTIFYDGDFRRFHGANKSQIQWLVL